MTAVMEPTVTLTGRLNETKRREMLFREALFDATRPADPAWCDGTCHTIGHTGDGILHYAGIDTVPAALDLGSDETSDLEVRAWRYDSLDEASSGGIEISEPVARLLFDTVQLTPAAARRLAVLLTDAADRVEPEFEVSAWQVRIDDWIRRDCCWAQVDALTGDECARAGSSDCVLADLRCASIECATTVGAVHYCRNDAVRVHRGGDPR